MSEQQFLWNSLDGGENVFIKERGSDKIIHIKIMEGKHEFVDFMKKVNEQQATIDNQEQRIKILQQEINDTQAILEMQSEKLKGWGDE